MATGTTCCGGGCSNKCCGKKKKCGCCVNVFCGNTGVGPGGVGATGATGATGPSTAVTTAFIQFWLRANDAERYPLAPGEAIILPETVVGPTPNSPTIDSGRTTITINLQGTYLIQWSVAYDPASTTYSGGALVGNIDIGTTLNGSPMSQLRYVQRSITYQNQPGQPSFYIQGTGIAQLQSGQTLQLFNFSSSSTIGQPAWSIRTIEDVGASLTLVRIGESIF